MMWVFNEGMYTKAPLWVRTQSMEITGTVSLYILSPCPGNLATPASQCSGPGLETRLTASLLYLLKPLCVEVFRVLPQVKLSTNELSHSMLWWGTDDKSTVLWEDMYPGTGDLVWWELCGLTELVTQSPHLCYLCLNSSNSKGSRRDSA